MSSIVRLLSSRPCVKAMVVERKDVWFMDDGALTYTFCEDDSPMGAAPIVEPCCACDEAKYEVVFEGLWSRHTHPKAGLPIVLRVF